MKKENHKKCKQVIFLVKALNHKLVSYHQCLLEEVIIKIVNITKCYNK